MNRRTSAAALALCAFICACSRTEKRADARLMLADSVPVLVGAGDIAECDSPGAEETAELLDTIRGTVFIAGDAGYATKRNPNPFTTCYAATWGRHRARTRPTPGNHDYSDGGPDRYYDYFGDLAGPRNLGYYSYDLGTWHVVALNTNIASEPGSAQDAWLRADLEAHHGQCGVAYMHHPRFSSGPHTERDRVIPVWKTLATHGVSVVIAGHDHIYERFAPLDAGGNADSVHGVRQFVAGTGGAERYRFSVILPGSEARSGDAWGLLKLSLLPGRYKWQFIPVEKNGFHDDGESTCHVMHAAS
ncbi:MAG: metallophosphoesterase [bacterium]